jgi:hypothetical protein
LSGATTIRILPRCSAQADDAQTNSIGDFDMHKFLIAAAAIGFAAGPALAQTAPDQSSPTQAAPSHIKPHHHHKTRTNTRVTGSGEKPVDAGPNTPEANSAYQGGGVVLQGQPGGPAPTPQATPPGETPQNAVPR